MKQIFDNEVTRNKYTKLFGNHLKDPIDKIIKECNKKKLPLGEAELICIHFIAVQFCLGRIARKIKK
jgi:hypothetical protein